MKRLIAVIGATWLLGCVHPIPGAAPDSDDEGVRSSRVSAARMYEAAESMVEAGYYADAVRLMRHSILSLPREPETDGLRHALVMRMAHVQLLAANAERDSAYARDAAQMLLSYGERHAELFGDDAAQERADVYELLYQAETFAEMLESRDPQAAASEATATEQATAYRSRVLDNEADTHEGEALEETVTRDVRVRRGWFYDPDDPRVRQRLEGWFSDADGYTFLTTPGTAVLSGPRPMVRRSGRLDSIALQGVPEPQRQTLRSLARSVLRESRAGLRDCYREAAARGGELQTDATLELTVTPIGSVNDVTVVSGDVVDGLGDACVIEHLDQTSLSSDELPRIAVRMRMPLLFFYDGPNTMPEQSIPENTNPNDRFTKPIPHPGIDGFAFPTN
ncbi:MAG: hypothetical protein KUG77_24740 [Nannocystaceae bacterium]|nr:hypothetical protein [Nannocystaceae bacterium]